MIKAACASKRDQLVLVTLRSAITLRFLIFYLVIIIKALNTCILDRMTGVVTSHDSPPDIIKTHLQRMHQMPNMYKKQQQAF